MRSHGEYGGWGDVVRFAACTAARIGEVSGVRRKDVNRERWTWDLCRQTTTAPGGLLDKGTKGKRRRSVPLIPEIRELVAWRLDVIDRDPMARLFTGRGAAGSRPPYCGTRRTGTKWWWGSATSTCGATISDTPG
ncbi:hypothetical protein [Kitasatospora indigofera]|uniref:hypothetical protein n=1 Tax=Kitasatospora indigofera TaxID=67307 RepID=UPI0036898614